MDIDRARARKAFAEYVRPYGTDNPRIALKVVHTNRVADSCDDIARSLGMDEDDVDLAWLCGLLHDIGRFEQLRIWDTFSDGDSASHAHIGVEALFGKGASGDAAAAIDSARRCDIRRFLDDRAQDGLIRETVARHSDFRLPEGIDGRTRTFCEIVRDADKVDILRTLQENTVETILKVPASAFLGARFSPEALAAFRSHRCLRRDERHSPADYLLGLVAFVYELEYPESRKILRDRGYLQTFLERPFGIEPVFDDPETQRIYGEISREASAAVKA